MKRTWIRLAMVLVVALVGLAVAQEAVIPELQLDPRTWFANPFALAALVVAVTGFVKSRFNTHGYVTLAVSFAVGVGTAVAASFNLPYFGTLFHGSLVEALTYGATAAVIASGGWDVVKALLVEGLTGLGKRS
jgi:hypothetical protein